MSSIPIALARRDRGLVTRIPSLAAAGAPGPWLVVVPHDDDMVIGMGLAVQAAVAEGIRVDVAIVSDGRMGYAEPSERATIQAVRKGEMERSCALLGIPAARLHWFGYPDSDLQSWQGRRFTDGGGTTGIAGAITALIRTLAPACVFGPTRADLHPDHVTVATELAISCYHAGGDIWLELGKPVPVPARWDFACYCPFPGEPTLELRANDAAFAKKLAGIAAFASQRQISSTVEALRTGGPAEYLQMADWKPFSPAQYAPLFRSDAAGAQAQTAADVGRNFAADCARVGPLLAAWPEQPWEPLAAALADREHPLMVVGEGSSRLFPAALACAIARHGAARDGGSVRVDHLGGREAMGVDLSGCHVLAMSNSGQTREVVELVERLRAGPRPHSRLLAMVGQPGGRLTELVPRCRTLLDAPETTVAATVSVFAQALALAQAVAHAAGVAVPLARLRAATAEVFAHRPMLPALSALTAGEARVARVWWSGDESGPAGELALKTMETAGCIGVHLPGSMVLHGIEEVLDESDLVVLLDPPESDLSAIHERIGATGASIVRLGPGGDWDLPDLGLWSGFPQLVASWRLLGMLALARGRDPDKPKRARKVGNHFASAAASGKARPA